MKLSANVNKKIGFWDKAGRFYLFPDWETETSRIIRDPSRAYPFSVYKHIQTKKYFNSLTDSQREELKNYIIS